jgi:hypothetical protein
MSKSSQLRAIERTSASRAASHQLDLPGSRRAPVIDQTTQRGRRSQSCGRKDDQSFSRLFRQGDPGFFYLKKHRKRDTLICAAPWRAPWL